MMRLLLVCGLIIAVICQSAQAGKRGKGRRTGRKLKEGDGINFPWRPLSKAVAEDSVFGKTLYVIYRLRNPVLENIKDHELVFEKQDNGDVIETSDVRIDSECISASFLYNPIPGERNRAVYTSDGPVPTTGEGLTVSFFSSYPDEYVFIFFCLDRTKEVIRRGRRVFCDGPWTIMFATYEFPPDKVKWCAAENDLWNNFYLTFDNEFMRYELSGQRCPSVDDEDVVGR